MEIIGILFVVIGIGIVLASCIDGRAGYRFLCGGQKREERK